MTSVVKRNDPSFTIFGLHAAFVTVYASHRSLLHVTLAVRTHAMSGTRWSTAQSAAMQTVTLSSAKYLRAFSATTTTDHPYGFGPHIRGRNRRHSASLVRVSNAPVCAVCEFSPFR